MGARRGHVDGERLTGSGHARAAFAATHGPDLLYSMIIGLVPAR